MVAFVSAVYLYLMNDIRTRHRQEIADIHKAVEEEEGALIDLLETVGYPLPLGYMHLECALPIANCILEHLLPRHLIDETFISEDLMV